MNARILLAMSIACLSAPSINTYYIKNMTKDPITLKITNPEGKLQDVILNSKEKKDLALDTWDYGPILKTYTITLERKTWLKYDLKISYNRRAEPQEIIWENNAPIPAYNTSGVELTEDYGKNLQINLVKNPAS